MKTSIFRACPFANIQSGLLHLLGESTPAPAVAGWSTANVHVTMRLSEMHPFQVHPERWVADSLQSPTPPPSFYRSVALLQGGSPALSLDEGIVCSFGANGVYAFSVCLSSPAAFSMQSLSFGQEASRAFRPGDCPRPSSLAGGELALAALG
jgi:hypothetical protein